MAYELTKKQKRYLPIKRILDIIICVSIGILLAPIMLLFSLAIKIDSSGPVLFKQKRVGKDRVLFEIWKFRTMRIDTPKDTPTHMLNNPEQYITRTGRFMRKYSIDELPQLYQCIMGAISLVGPRPALWNQDDLVAERDKYGVNAIKPGITGWAQINGRDELEICDKAKLDGEYLKNFGFRMDLKCVLGTIRSVLYHDGVIEGGTGTLHEKTKNTSNIVTIELKEDIVFKGMEESYNITQKQQINYKKKILITGANSYIGLSVKSWLEKYPHRYYVESLDIKDDKWLTSDFSKFDVIYHVAGIAHADIGHVSEEQKQLYYKVNTHLAIQVAQKAKCEGIKQFIYMSSMIVYSGCKDRIITAETQPRPLNFYGDSKWQADQKIRQLSDKEFKVVVLRPPMIYGRNSKGNYSVLAKIAKISPVFPIVKNKRSMLYIDNLSEFIRLMIDNEESGIFFPQNSEYTNTSDMVQMIAKVSGHRIIMIPGLSVMINLLEKIPGKIGGSVNKAFGDSVYEMSMSEYKVNYRVNSLIKSIELTEGNGQ